MHRHVSSSVVWLQTLHRVTDNPNVYNNKFNAEGMGHPRVKSYVITKHGIVSIYYFNGIYMRFCALQLKYFDRRRDYIKFKEKMEKEGYDPVADSDDTAAS